MFEWFKIALRNTSRQKKRSFLLGGAIAFGFLVITLLNGFTSGLVISVKDNFSGMFGGHIFISGEEVSERGSIIYRISNPLVLDEVISEFQTDIKKTIQRSSMSGDAIFGTKSTLVLIDGINYEKEPDFFSNVELLEGTAEEASQPGSIMIPDEVASKLGIQLGETILYSTTTVTGQKNVGEFVLRGIVKSQTGFGFSSGFASIVDVNDLIGLPPEGFTSFNLYLHSMESIDPIGDALYASLSEKADVAPREGEEEEEGHRGPGGGMGAMFMGGALPKAEEPWEGTKYTFTTLNEIMSDFMSLIGVLKTISLVVFIILLVITMVGILNTYRMVMIERTREIGTMRAIGVQKGGIRSIFVWEAGIIALGGALAGLIAAGIIMLIMGFISFSDITFLSFFLREGKINFAVEAGEVITNLLLLLGLSLFSAYLPARAAAKLKPADALRTEY